MKDWKALFEKAQDPNELSAIFFKESSRTELKSFLQIFRKDYHDKIDWDKGYELLDDEMSKYLPADFLEQKNSFDLFVKAHLKTGGTCRFLIHTIMELEEGHIKVGIADVPDDAMGMAEEDMDDDEEDFDADMEHMALKFLENFAAKLKAGQLKRPDNSPNCSRCGRTDLPLTITINASTMSSQQICSVCMNNSGASGKVKPKKVNIKKLDKEIAEMEILAKKYEELIKDHPIPDDLPSELSKYAITPMSSYKSIQAILADLRSQRMAAMTSMDAEPRLEYELKKAVASEDYKKSAQLRDKLKKIKK